MTAAKYHVRSDTSTRSSPDPESPGYETWIHWAAGDIATTWPDHTPVEQWVASGHWEPARARSAKAEEEVTP